MNYEHSQTPTTGPLQTPTAPQSPSAISPLLGLQGLIGNAGLLDLLRPQMHGAQADAGPSPLTGALQTVLKQDTTTPNPPPGGTEAPSTAVASTLADEGQTAALTSAPSSPVQSAAAQVTALDETQDGVEGAITASPALTTAVAAELGTTPSEVQAQAQDPWQPSWWDDAVDWTVGGVGGLVDGGVDLLSDVPVLGAAAATMAPVTKFAWETLGGFAKGAGDLVGGLGHMAAHPLDTLSGLATMAEHIPFSPLKPLHKLYDVATTDKTLEETFWRNPLDVAKEDLSADWDFWKKVGGAVIDPYERSVEQGKYAEALGRGIFDIGGLFVGASEAKAVTKGAEVVNVLEHASVLNKVDDSVKIATRANELGAVTDDIMRAGGKADDLTKGVAHVDEAADLSKADDATKLAQAVAPEPLATHADDTQQLTTHADDAPARTTEPAREPESKPAPTTTFDPLTANDDEIWKKATSKDPEAAAARAELKLRNDAAKMSDADLAHIATEGHPDPRMVELAQRESAIRKGILDTYEQMAKDGTLQNHLGHFPAPNAETVAAARQVHGLMSEAGISRGAGAAVQTAQLADGTIVVGVSGGAKKVAAIRQKVALPDGFRWAEDAVPFRRDEFVGTPTGDNFNGGQHCAEPKVFLSKGEDMPVTNQATMWYGQNNPWPAPGTGLGSGSFMDPCYSCLQHSERFMTAPGQLKL